MDYKKLLLRLIDSGLLDAELVLDMLIKAISSDEIKDILRNNDMLDLVESFDKKDEDLYL
tara:strand:- start:5463 stop:5642 length:180 start_codon:yes stop_codon:yes gene_type:complete